MDNFDPDKLFNKDIIKRNLLLASLYITGYEILKHSIIEDVKTFFSVGYDPNKGNILSPQYQTEVLSLDSKSVFRASCLWLAKMEAITDDDIEQIDIIRKHRNKIGHELPLILTDKNYDIDISLLRKMKYYIRTINSFWGKVELSINPDIDLNDVDFLEIRSGRDILFEHLINIVENEISK